MQKGGKAIRYLLPKEIDGKIITEKLEIVIFCFIIFILKEFMK